MADDSQRTLEGKTALVTGSGRGLGRAFAETLARLGCNIGVHGMREDGPSEYGEGTTLTETARQIGEDFGVKTVRVLGDLTKMDQVENVVETVSRELGPIDFLVHNAGGDVAAKGGKPNPNDAVNIKVEDVQAVLDRNLLSTIYVCQQAARRMMERKSGRIVTISSIAAFQGSANSAIYSTAKAAVVEYTRCLAMQLRPYDITAWPPEILGRGASWARGKSIRTGWRIRARWSELHSSMKSRGSSNFSPDHSARS